MTDRCKQRQQIKFTNWNRQKNSIKEMNKQAITNGKQLLHRPPKPQGQKPKQIQNLTSVHTNNFVLNFQTNNVRLIYKRPTSQDNAKNGIRFIRKKIQDNDNNSPINSHGNHVHGPDGFNSLLVTPKYVSAQSKPSTHNTASLQPNAFKIRNISIQMKKAKQNVQNLEPNIQINNVELLDKDQIKIQKSYTSQNKKQKKAKNFFQQAQPIQLQFIKFERNPLQRQLIGGISKSGIQTINNPLKSSELCIIIQQSLFEQDILSEQSLFELKSLTDRIFHATHSIIILKLHRKQKVQHIKQYLNQLNIHLHHLNYIVWNQDKYYTSTNFVNLPNMDHVHHFISIYRQFNQVVDLYVPHPHTNGIQVSHTYDITKRNQFLYLQVRDMQKLNIFISKLCIKKQVAKVQQSEKEKQTPRYTDENNINENNKISQQSTSLSTSIHFEKLKLPQEWVIQFDKSSQIVNKTYEIYQNNEILQKIRLYEIQQQKRSKNILLKQKQRDRSKQKNNMSNMRTKSKQEISKNAKQVNTQFDQNFKMKMVQYAKIIYSQSKQKHKQQKQQTKTNQLTNNNCGNNSINNCTNNYNTNYNSMNANTNYMYLRLPQSMGSLLGGCQVSANTAYQFVGELLRNNGFNYKQISLYLNQYNNKI